MFYIYRLPNRNRRLCLVVLGFITRLFRPSWDTVQEESNAEVTVNDVRVCRAASSTQECMHIAGKPQEWGRNEGSSVVSLGLMT